MSSAQPTVVALLTGPTAVGKSDLALALAEAHGWEIVSIDSRQVYRGLPIGTAQPSAAEQARVRHHLIACLDPRESCSAGRFRELFAEVLADLEARGRRALAVGGTGLYWEAIARGIHELPPASPEIRARHAAIIEAEGVSGLRRRLERVDPASAARFGALDRQRIGRALEVLELTGRTLSDHIDASLLPPLLSGTPVIWMSRERGELYARIEARCGRMLELGLVDELRALLASGCPATAPGLRTVGYRQLLPHVLEGRPLERCREEFGRETRRYAKRQETWFRHRLGASTRLDTSGEEPLETLLSRLEQAVGTLGLQP